MMRVNFSGPVFQKWDPLSLSTFIFLVFFLGGGGGGGASYGVGSIIG